MTKIVVGLLLALVVCACAAGLANRRDPAVRLTVVNTSQYNAFRVQVCLADGRGCRTIGRVYSLGTAGPFLFRPSAGGNVVKLDFIGGGEWLFRFDGFEGERWVLNVGSSPGASYFTRPSVANDQLSPPAAL